MSQLQGQMTKYAFQKESKIPYLDCAGYKTLIRLRKRRFRCKDCRKIAIAETSLVKKNHQIATIVKKSIFYCHFFRIASIFFMENRTKKATKAIWNQTE